MTAVINGIMVTGTPNEIAQLMTLVSIKSPAIFKTGTFTSPIGTTV